MPCYQQLFFAVLLQLCLCSQGFAAPVGNEIVVQTADPWQYGTGGGVAGFIVLVVDIIVWIEVIQSTRPISHKILWCVLVFLFPIIGAIIYFLFSNREAHKRGGYEPIAGSA